MSVTAWRVLPVLIALIIAGIAAPASATAPGWQGLYDRLNTTGSPLPGLFPGTVRSGETLSEAAVLSPDWRIEVVDPTIEAGFTTSLALDPEGNPRIAYDNLSHRGPTSEPVRYAWKDGSGWHHRKTPFVYGMAPQLHLDGSGRPRISYLRYGGYGTPGGTACTTTGSPGFSTPLFYGWKDGSGWHSELVDRASLMFPVRCPLDLNGTGKPRISYTGSGEAGMTVMYAAKGNAWQSDPVNEPASWIDIFETSIALDSAGNPGIACAYCFYGEPLTYNIGYIWKDGSGWHRETVASETAMIEYVSLARDGAGRPRIVYIPSDGKVKYAWKNGGTWQETTVDTDGMYVGSLALDSAGNPRIAYLSGTMPGTRGDSPMPFVTYAWKDKRMAP